MITFEEKKFQKQLIANDGCKFQLKTDIERPKKKIIKINLNCINCTSSVFSLIVFYRLAIKLSFLNPPHHQYNPPPLLPTSPPPPPHTHEYGNGIFIVPWACNVRLNSAFSRVGQPTIMSADPLDLTLCVRPPFIYFSIIIPLI